MILPEPINWVPPVFSAKDGKRLQGDRTRYQVIFSIVS
jgi:hypothetical protein